MNDKEGRKDGMEEEGVRDQGVNGGMQEEEGMVHEDGEITAK